MTPRQRVLTALAHEQPDQIPVDFSGHRSSGIAAIAYAKLRGHLGLEEKPIRIYDVQQQLAIVDNDVRVMLHCCGGVYELLEHLIDAGLDATNPVQIACQGMDSASLKRDFGDRLTFQGGGCDTQRVLSTGTPQEVTAHVRQQIEIFSPGGGFVFQQVHNILANVRPENIVAMFDATLAARGSP